jgi:hypothetical protein
LKNSPKLLLLISLLFTGIFSATTYWIGIKHSEMFSSEKSNKWSNIDIVLEHLANNYVDSLEIENLSENSINNILNLNKDLVEEILILTKFENNNSTENIFLPQVNKSETFETLTQSSTNSLQNLSTPDFKLYYPEPFVASPSFVHEEV